MYYLIKGTLLKRLFEDLETLSICNTDFNFRIQIFFYLSKKNFRIQITKINILQWKKWPLSKIPQ